LKNPSICYSYLSTWLNRFGEQLNQSESMKKDREEERKRLQSTQSPLRGINIVAVYLLFL